MVFIIGDDADTQRVEMRVVRKLVGLNYERNVSLQLVTSTVTIGTSHQHSPPRMREVVLINSGKY